MLPLPCAPHRPLTHTASRTLHRKTISKHRPPSRWLASLAPFKLVSTPESTPQVSIACRPVYSSNFVQFMVGLGHSMRTRNATVQHDVVDQGRRPLGRAAEELSSRRRGSLALITLNRPRALNALNAGDAPEARRRPIRASRAIRRITPSSSSRRARRRSRAGGDVRELVRWGREDRHEARRAFAEEYALNWLHECFSKPTISLIDGAGDGLGRRHHALRHASRRRRALQFAMPETAIGLFPDVGAALRARAAAGRDRHVPRPHGARRSDRRTPTRWGSSRTASRPQRFEEIKAALDRHLAGRSAARRAPRRSRRRRELEPYAGAHRRAASRRRASRRSSRGWARRRPGRALGRKASSRDLRRARRCRSR